MKKATTVLIALIYVASVFIIAIFGLSGKVYQENIFVTRVECTNTSNSFVTVTEQNGQKVLKRPFTTVGDLTDDNSTIIELTWRVYPDNASNKEVKFVYNEDAYGDRIEFGTGLNKGTIMFSGKVMMEIQIMATDGTKVEDKILIWIY